jgi:hypothetical protein
MGGSVWQQKVLEGVSLNGYAEVVLDTEREAAGSLDQTPAPPAPILNDIRRLYKVPETSTAVPIVLEGEAPILYQARRQRVVRETEGGAAAEAAASAGPSSARPARSGSGDTRKRPMDTDSEPDDCD